MFEFAKSAKKYAIPILVLFSVVFFVFFRLSVINQIWSDRVLPPEPDDSFAYVAGIKTVGDSGYYFFDLKHIWSWNNNDHLLYLPWKTVLLFVRFLGDFDYFDVYKVSFYSGIFILPFILLYLFKVLHKDKLFFFFAFVFLAFYTGSGEYHGFFWVVPSFFSVAATFLLVGIVFDESILINLSKKRYVLLIGLVTIWAVWSHPLGKFSFVAVVLSYLFYIFLSKVLHLSPSLKDSIKRFVPLVLCGIFVIFLLEILPYVFGVTPSRYYSLQGMFGQAFVESSLSMFQKLYLNYFQIYGYNFFFLIIGLAVTFFTKKLSLLSVWLGFFITAGSASFFGNLGYRMLVFLWPITFILFSYGLYFIAKQAINRLQKSFLQLLKKKVQQTCKRSWSNCIQSKKTKSLLALLVAFISVIYVCSFFQENYNWAVKYADYQNQRMSDWSINTSIVDYLNEKTQSGDLIIFSDSNAFLYVTSLGLKEREVAYSDWNWKTSYSFLLDKVNGSYLLSTGIPQKNRIQNLTSAFDNRLTLNFVVAYSFLNIYTIVVNQATTEHILDYDGINTKPLVGDYQESFWTKTTNIDLFDSNSTKVEGNVSLLISLSQTKTDQTDFLWHEYDSTQDWSNENGIYFYWYGSGSHKHIEILILAPDISNRYAYIFIDDFVGWNQMFISLRDFASLSGNPSLANVRALYFSFNLDSPYYQTYYLDELAVGSQTSITEFDINLLNTSFQTNLAIAAIFFAVIFLPGLLWGFHMFFIQDNYALFAIAIGLSFSLLTICTFVLNVFGNIEITELSLMLVFAFVVILPLLFNLSKLERSNSYKKLGL